MGVVILTLTLILLSLQIQVEDLQMANKKWEKVAYESLEDIDNWETTANDALDLAIELGAALIECKQTPLDSITSGRLKDELIKRGYN
jgi:hypothetical protein